MCSVLHIKLFDAFYYFFFSGRNQNQKWPGPVTPLQISRVVAAILSLCPPHRMKNGKK